MKNICTALCEAQKKFTTIEKKRQGYNFVYADLSDIWEMIREPLTANGLSLVQLINSTEGRNYVVTKLLHTSGECIESSTLIEFSAKKFQDVGTAITYYRRYALSALLGIVSDQDVDDKLEKQTEIYEKSTNITSVQAKKIQDKINGHDDILKRMLKTYKSINTIPADHYEQVIKTIDKLIADKDTVLL